MLFFLYGEDEFRSRQKVSAIKEKYLKSDPTGSGLSVFDFEEKASAQKIIDTISTPNLLAPKRLVLVKKIISSGGTDDQEKFLEYLKKQKSILTDTDAVLFVWDGKISKKSNAIFKYLVKNAKAQEFELLKGLKLNQWILKRIKEIDPKGEISQPALEKLIAYVGKDMNSLDNELQKLISFAEGKTIQDEDVEKMVKSKVDANIFATIDALANRNKKQALKLLHDHLEKGDDPFYLLSMLVFQFRNLLVVSDLKEKLGPSEHTISQASKMHPFVIKKSLGQLQKYSAERLRRIFRKLCEIDIKSKTGKIDIKLALDKFIVEL